MLILDALPLAIIETILTLLELPNASIVSAEMRKFLKPGSISKEKGLPCGALYKAYSPVASSVSGS